VEFLNIENNIGLSKIATLSRYFA